MSTLRKGESIECVISPLPSGLLSVRTILVRTTPRAGRVEVAHFEAVRFRDFPYESSASYLAKRIRNMVAGATHDPELF